MTFAKWAPFFIAAEALPGLTFNARVTLARGFQTNKSLNVDFENESGQQSAAKLLTRDKARRIAANIARLPVIMKATSRDLHHSKLAESN